MGIYSAILAAAKTKLTALLTADGWKVFRAREPEWPGSHVMLPACVVAPRKDLEERVHKVMMGNQCQLAFDLYVGLFADDRAQDEASVDRRADARERVRLSLWRPKSLDLADLGEYGVEYDPSGSGGKEPAGNVVGSWQKFTLLVGTSRFDGGI